MTNMHYQRDLAISAKKERLFLLLYIISLWCCTLVFSLVVYSTLLCGTYLLTYSIFCGEFRWKKESRCKGQLISKCPFGVKTSSKIPTKFFLDFCPEIFCSFLGASLGLPGSVTGLPVGFLIYDITY